MPRDVPLPLDQPVELVGEWWLPAEPDNTATGRLSYDPDGGLVLDAMGGALFQTATPMPWILGRTVDGRRVTLRNSFMTRSTVNIPGGVHTILRANQAFVGIHASDEDDLSLNWLRARMTNLVLWSGVTGIEAEGRAGVFGKIEYGSVQPLALARHKGALLSAHFEISGTIEPRTRPTHVELEQRAWIRTQHRYRRGYDELIEHLQLFNNLLAFAAGSDSAFIELHGEATTRSDPELGTNRTFPQRVPVWVLFERLSSGTQQHNSRRMTFLLDDARAIDLRPVRRWFNRSPLLAPIYSLYVAQLRARTLDHRFLLTAQALEALHGRLRPRPQDVKFIRRIEQLEAALPASLRSHVPEHFPGLIRDTRNYYTHWSPRLQQRAATGERLYALTRCSKGLLEATLLMALGFPKTKVTKLVEGNNSLVYGWQGFHEI